MKFEIVGGAKVDLLSRDELKEELATFARAWKDEIRRGVKYRKFSAQTNVSGGVWLLGGDAPEDNNNALGPEPGFVWSITRIAINGNGFDPTSDDWQMYTDAVQPSKFILTNFGFGDQWDTGVIVLYGPERLAFRGVGTGVGGTDIHMTGQAVEVPVQLAHMLLG